MASLYYEDFVRSVSPKLDPDQSLAAQLTRPCVVLHEGGEVVSAGWLVLERAGVACLRGLLSVCLLSLWCRCVCAHTVVLVGCRA